MNNGVCTVLQNKDRENKAFSVSILKYSKHVRSKYSVIYIVHSAMIKKQTNSANAATRCTCGLVDKWID